jgi:hypothetical protein
MLPFTFSHCLFTLKGGSFLPFLFSSNEHIFKTSYIPYTEGGA